MALCLRRDRPVDGVDHGQAEDRIPAASPEPARLAGRMPMVDGRACALTGPAGFGYLWWPVSTGPKPQSWQEAAERRLAAGLAITLDGGAVLHGDAIGLQELYVRRVDDALYFALRIDPLLEVGEGSLHVDMTAWASTLLVEAPMMDATPFVEIRRHVPATAWCVRNGEITTLRFQPPWQSAEPDGAMSPERMVDIIAAGLPRRRFRRTAITLSGGWDSRLIAVLARRTRGSRLSGWTTDPDTGLTVDIDYAVDVATALNLRHQIVASPHEAWLEHHRETRRRLQYQSLQHTWLMPLTQEIKRHSMPVLSGFLGDALFRAHPPPYREVVHARSGAEVKGVIRQRVTLSVLNYPRLFAPGVADMVADLGHSAWDRVIESADYHPALLNLVRVHQNMRTVGPAFHWMLGPETDVVLPFAHADVISASLRFPQDRAETCTTSRCCSTRAPRSRRCARRTTSPTRAPGYGGARPALARPRRSGRRDRRPSGCGGAARPGAAPGAD